MKSIISKKYYIYKNNLKKTFFWNILIKSFFRELYISFNRDITIINNILFYNKLFYFLLNTYLLSLSNASFTLDRGKAKLILK